jgi:gamma-glutamyltranspeptidase/glutathione hydrolase/leukotriene-C4 hydrolase
MHEDKYTFLKRRETAPAAATQDMFVSSPLLARTGGLSVAVPGELQGMYTAWLRHGRLSWAMLFTSAIAYATECDVSAHMADAIARNREDILSFEALANVYAPGGELLVEGSILKQPALASTLSAVATFGPKALYEGDLAQALVDDVQQAGGILTVADLTGYSAQVSSTNTAAVRALLKSGHDFIRI